MLKESYPYYLANKPVFDNTDLEVTDKFSGEVVTRVAMAGAGAIQEAFDKAEEAREAMQALPAYHRQEVLNHCVHRFIERQEELGSEPDTLGLVPRIGCLDLPLRSREEVDDPGHSSRSSNRRRKSSQDV